MCLSFEHDLVTCLEHVEIHLTPPGGMTLAADPESLFLVEISVIHQSQVMTIRDSYMSIQNLGRTVVL